MNIHLAEEIEYEASRGDRLWDAGEGVCCAAFQLGACPHTEDEGEAAWDTMWEQMTPAERAAYDAEVADFLARRDAELAAAGTNPEPF